MNEYTNGGVNQRWERLGQRKRIGKRAAREEMQQEKKCNKQVPVAALGSVTPYSSARSGMPAGKINLLGLAAFLEVLLCTLKYHVLSSHLAQFLQQETFPRHPH